MAALSKRSKLARGKIDSTAQYMIDDALALVKEFATAKFPESRIGIPAFFIILVSLHQANLEPPLLYQIPGVMRTRNRV